MDLSKLGTLKMKAIAENDFAPIWEYFLDNFAENDEFMSIGERLDVTDHPVKTALLLSAAMAFASSGMRPDKSAPSPDIRAIYVPEEKFIHGGVVVQRTMGAFFYFEDLDVGLLSITMSPSKTIFLRISVRPNKDRNLHKV